MACVDRGRTSRCRAGAARFVTALLIAALLVAARFVAARFVAARFVAGLLVAAFAVLGPGSPSMAASPPDDVLQGDVPTGGSTVDDGPAVVTIPQLPYDITRDVFRVGPFVSLLEVLDNDSGPRDRSTLQLLDGRGRPVDRVAVATVGAFTVADGQVRLDPASNLGGTATLTYRAAPPLGDSDTGEIVVVATRAISAVDDRARARPGQTITIPIASNDTLLVTGAYTVCGPRLSATTPVRPDTVVVVEPEPARPPVRQCPPPETLQTADGTWVVAADGTLRFTAAASARGTARIWYSQDADYPFDIGTAQVVVAVTPSGRPTTDPGATPTPSTSVSPSTRPGDGDGNGDDGSGDDGSGDDGSGDDGSGDDGSGDDGSGDDGSGDDGSGDGGGSDGGGSGASAGGSDSSGGSAAGGPSGGLALTGADLLSVLLLGGGLVAAGGVALVVSRRRRTTAAASTAPPRRLTVTPAP